TLPCSVFYVDAHGIRVEQSQGFFLLPADDLRFNSLIHSIDRRTKGKDEKSLVITQPKQGGLGLSHSRRRYDQDILISVLPAENLQIILFGVRIFFTPSLQQVFHVLFQKIMGKFAGDPGAGAVVASVEKALDLDCVR